MYLGKLTTRFPCIPCFTLIHASRGEDTVITESHLPGRNAPSRLYCPSPLAPLFCS